MRNTPISNTPYLTAAIKVRTENYDEAKESLIHIIDEIGMSDAFKSPLQECVEPVVQETRVQRADICVVNNLGMEELTIRLKSATVELAIPMDVVMALIKKHYGAMMR